MIYLIIFILTYYLGLVGYSQPSKIISVISSIAFIAFAYNALKNIKEYILPLSIVIIVYLWSRFMEHLPIYGEYVIYNPFSVFGLGNQFYGEKIEPQITCDGELKEKIEIKNISNHNIFSKTFSLIIQMLSAFIFVFGFSWIGASQLVSVITNLNVMLFRTGLKSILGYVPKQDEKDNNLFNYYMQDRIASDNILSKLTALVRRFTLIGVDMDALDSIFESVHYNDLGDAQYCERRRLYEMKENPSLLEQWRWETLPYMHHWMQLSLIAYVFYLFSIIIG